MNVSLIAKMLWAADFVLHAALIFVLFYRRRYRTVPWFTTWIVSGEAFTVATFLSYRLSSHSTYAALYWTADFLDLLLQIAVVLEIARSVLRRSGRWVEGARARLVMVGALAPVLALGMAWAMKPAAATPLDAWEARTSLFTTILVCLLFTSVMFTSQQLGLGWRSHVMREGYGLTAWALTAFLIDTLHAYWRTAEHFTALENVRIAVFQVSMVYWAAAFWVPEQVPVPVSGDAKKHLEGLETRLRYGLSHSASPLDGPK